MTRATSRYYRMAIVGREPSEDGHALHPEGGISMPLLPIIQAKRKSGDEPFLSKGEAFPFDVTSFWRWAFSDFVSNTARGILAEYIVARAVGIGDTDIRPEWAPFDVTTPEGIKIEVKSAAYIQSWQQNDYSKISFSVAKKRGWDAQTGLAVEPTRHSDVYVLALLHHKDQMTLNPLDLDQWSFYVLTRQSLDARDRSQHSITMPSITGTGINCFGLRPVSYFDLGAAVRAAGAHVLRGADVPAAFP